MQANMAVVNSSMPTGSASVRPAVASMASFTSASQAPMAATTAGSLWSSPL
jgi:hypothetical protein